MSVLDDDCAMLLHLYQHHPEEGLRRRVLEEIERRDCPSICEQMAELILQGDTRLIPALRRSKALEANPGPRIRLCEELGRPFLEAGGDPDPLRDLQCLKFVPGLDQQVLDATLGTTDDSRIVAGMHVLLEGHSPLTADLLRALIVRDDISSHAKRWAIELLSRVRPAPPWARETVLPFLNDPDPELRLNACYALGDLGLPEDLSALEPLFDDPATGSGTTSVAEMAHDSHEAIAARRDYPELYADEA